MDIGSDDKTCSAIGDETLSETDIWNQFPISAPGWSEHYFLPITLRKIQFSPIFLTRVSGYCDECVKIIKLLEIIR